MGNVPLPSLFGAFAAGFLSFLSPCVLPLIPVYLSFISGESLTQIRNEQASKFRLFLRSLSFVLGFTAVFVLLALLFGAGARFIGSTMPLIIMKAAGIFVIILGLNMLFDFIPFLRGEVKAQLPREAAGFSKAFLFGMLFAAGWSPCIGPILSSILLFAAQSGNAAYSAILLCSYSLGLGIPFLLTGLFFDKAEPVLRWFKKHARGVKISAGLMIIFFGILMLTSGLSGLSILFIKMGYALEEYAKSGTPPFSTIAGVLAQWLQFQGM
ncbi:MAG: cytochrome c biogenesis CcdA family protein [Treponema sp.]